MNDGEALSPQAGRHGEHVRAGGVSFRCAACGEMAAVVQLVRAGTTVNMGPPLGEQACDREGVVVDLWLGATRWRRLDPARWARIGQVLAAGQPDPAGLYKIDWELAAYWCRDCRPATGIEWRGSVCLITYGAPA
jgi:hypothetical protein